jgi:hypothetical protein
LAVFVLAAVISLVGVGKTQALSFTSPPLTGFAAAGCSKPKLLGIFVPWYQYLKVSKDADTGDCGIQDFHLLPGKQQTDTTGRTPNSDVPLILLAVVDDMVRLAGLIAVIFVIMGGVQYATSQGSPDATAKAQSTIVNALIGLAIAIVAVAFVTFLGNALT